MSFRPEPGQHRPAVPENNSDTQRRLSGYTGANLPALPPRRGWSKPGDPGAGSALETLHAPPGDEFTWRGIKMLLEKTGPCLSEKINQSNAAQMWASAPRPRANFISQNPLHARRLVRTTSESGPTVRSCSFSNKPNTPTSVSISTEGHVKNETSCC